MYHNNEKLATTLYEIMDNLILEGEDTPVSIDKLLTPKQKYDLIMTIVAKLPKDGLAQVQHFHQLFNIPKEESTNVTEFKQRELRFRLILEEALELAFSLGFTRDAIYNNFIVLLNKVHKEELAPTLTNVFDSLIDLLFVVNGSVDVFNLSPIIDEGQDEVYASNISKLIPDTEEGFKFITESVKKLTEDGYSVVSEKLNNGYIAIKDSNTGKILKPTSHFRPKLELIIHKHLNK